MLRIVTGAAALLLVSALSAPTYARDIRVPERVRSLRQAIRQARKGDRILVNGGVHRGSFRIRRSDITISASKGATIRRSRLIITGDGVTFEGFRFKQSALIVKGDDAVVHNNDWTDGHGRLRTNLVVNGARAQVLDNEIVSIERDVSKKKTEVVETVRVHGADVLFARNRLDSQQSGGGLDRRGMVLVADRAVLQDNDFVDGVLELTGDDLEIRGNQMAARANLVIEGHRCLVEDNVMSVHRPFHFSSKSSSVGIFGDDAVLRDNAFGDLGYPNEVNGVSVTGDRTVFEGNEVAVGGDRLVTLTGSDCRVADSTFRSPNRGTTRADEFCLGLVGDRAVVTDCTFEGGRTAIRSEGDDLSVSECDVVRHASGWNTATAFHVTGDRAALSANNVDAQWHGVDLRGDGARITANTFVGENDGVFVVGADAVVADNAAEGHRRHAYLVAGDRATVTGNSATRVGWGVRVTGNAFDVSGNDIAESGTDPIWSQSGDPAPATRGIWIVSQEPGGTLADNRVTHHAGRGISVEGSSVSLSGNHVETLTEGALEAIYVAGDSNSVASATVQGVTPVAIHLLGAANSASDCTVQGVDVHGILIEGDGATVSACTVNDCRRSGLANRGTRTAVIGSTFVGNHVADILTLSAFDRFEDNVFDVRFDGTEAADRF